MNDDLHSLHAMLVTKVLLLAAAQEKATTPKAIGAVGREIDEMGHRATIVGQLLFKQQTAQLTAAVNAVQGAESDLDAAIAEVDKVNAFLKTISGFLELVDKAIDLAKLI